MAPTLNRRNFLRASLGAAICSRSLAARQAAARRPPNILFIYTDDQGPWTLGVEGNREARTPNLDRLFRGSAHLRNSFVSTPVCSPSRASLMTSRYGSELGITDYLNFTEERDRGLDPSLVTFPEALAAAGYRTALLGKWHLGATPRYHPTQHGFQHFVGFMRGNTGPADPVLEIDGKEKQLRGSTIDILTDYGMDFLRRERDRPFLLCMHYREPHASNAPDTAGKDRTWLPLRDEDWDSFRNLDPKIPNPGYPDLDVPRVKRMTREYLGSIASIDRNVGRLLSALDESKLSSQTVIVFTSDNGFNIGHNGIWHKGNGRWILTNRTGNRSNMYDHSLRVPTAVRWPGVTKPGTTVSETISNVDWYPTLLAMANVPLPSGTVRGRNFLPLLEQKRIPWDNDLYGEYGQRHGAVADLRMWRTPEWKLIRDFHNPGQDELYHLGEDPDETRNLNGSTEPAIQKVRRALNEKLLAKMRELNDPLLQKAARRQSSPA